MNARTIAAAACSLLLAGLTAAFAPTPAKGQLAPQYYFYLLKTHDMPAPTAIGIAKELGYLPAVQAPSTVLAAEPPDPCISFTDAGGIVRMLYFSATGQLQLFANLSQSFGSAPTQAAAEQTAMDFLSQHSLLPAVQDQGGSYVVTDVVTLANQSYVGPNVAGAVGGPTGPPVDVMQSVNYRLMLDGLQVMGPDYHLSADVASNGVIGFSYRYRYFRRLLGTTPQMISTDQAVTNFTKQLGPILKEARAGDPKTKYSWSGPDLVYYEQNSDYIQPAYAFKVLFTGSTGNQIGETLYIPAASNTPEPINNNPSPWFAASPMTVPPTNGGITTAVPHAKTGSPVHLASTSSAPAKQGVVYDPLDFGVYVVRDDNRFLNDANGFISNLEGNNFFANAFLGRGYPQTVLTQYYWDEPWMWENDPADDVPDNSPWFVGAENLVLFEGHGAPWEVSTYSNCCDLIYYPSIPGYGAYHSGSEITNYICWHTCDSIPAPGDPYGGDYSSPAGPFDVWWNIFQGMRGTYGSRTTVDIYDGVGPNFAAAAGLGVPNLSAWFNAESNDATGHGGGWDYASAVIISGHENDCIYDTGQASPPGSLTMWWQHP